MTIKPKTIYLSGAISGNPDYRKEFAFAEKELVKRGFAVVNPALRDGCDTWEEYMRADIADLVTKCDAVAIVNNILNSRGALLEYEIAFELRMEIRPIGEWLLSYSPEKQEGCNDPITD